MISLSLALHSFRHNYKTSDNRLIRLTQVALMFFLFTLTLTSNSVQNYLNENLQSLLGADIVVSRYQALNDEQLKELTQHSTKLSVSQTFTATLTNKDKWQQVQIKLVDDSYPVQGHLNITNSPGGEHSQQSKGPGRGEVWVDTRLYRKLNLEMGQQLIIGRHSLTVAAILLHEPDRIIEGHSVALRAMIHQDSLINGSNRRSLPSMAPRHTVLSEHKIHYRYLMNADRQQQDYLANWAEVKLPGAQVISKTSGNHPLALFWQRAENFIGLASILLFFMAAIAIDMAGRRALKQQKFRLALCLSMGMTLRQGVTVSLLEWIFSFILSLVPALILTYVGQWLLLEQLTTQFAGISADLHPLALGKTCLLLVVLLISFQLPGFLQLKNTAVTELIRQHQSSTFVLWRMVWNFASLSLLAAFYSDNILLTGMTITAMLCSLALMMVITLIVLVIGEKLTRARSGLLPFAFFMMKQRLLSKSTQILGVGLCATLLLFTLMLMKDIGGAIERNTRTQDGNLMITDAHEKHLNAIKNWSIKTASEIKQLRPFTFAQLIRVNGINLKEFSDRPSDSMASLKKPVRLSWSDTVPVNNQLNQGSWWPTNTENWQQISVETEVLTDTGITIGDRLSFRVGNKVAQFTVVASHDFKAGAGSVTFWFQIPSIAVAKINAEPRYMGSMELPDTAWPMLAELWQAHPTLIMLPLKELTARFDKILAILSKLVIGFSSMIIMMAMIVIVASSKGYEQEDRKKNGVLMSMGLGQGDCVRLSFYEWLITALISGAGAIAGVWIAGMLIYQSQFSLTYHPDVVWLVSALLIICLVVCAVGLFFCRASLKTSIVQLLSD